MDDPAANGLEYADGTQKLADVEGRDIRVRLARFVRDPETGTTDVRISDETVFLAEGFTSYSNPTSVITLDGVPLVLLDGAGALAGGQPVWSYMNYALEHSGTGGLYAYSYLSPEGKDLIDMEGFFSIGFETDPIDIANLSGAVDYRGSYFGYGQMLDLGGAVLDGEVRTIGAIRITADFDASTVDGRLDGFFDPSGENTPYLMVFFDSPIAGNGFAASPDMICGPSEACTSATRLGAVFYGPDGAEVAGVIGFDEIDDPAGSADATRFVGAAGFSAGIDSE